MEIEIHDTFADTLYDAGANISMISTAFLKRIKKEGIISKDFSFPTTSGGGVLKGMIILKTKIFNIEKLARFFVIDEDKFRYDALIGLDNIGRFRLCQDANLNIFQDNKGNSDTKERKEEGNDEIYINWNEFIQVKDFQARTNHLDKDKQKKVHDLIDWYGDVFAKNKYDIGRVTEYEAHIKLSENRYVAKKPYRCSKKPYRCSLDDQKEIENQITELLKHGMIEQSVSPFASPVTLAYKKEGDKKEKNRMCVDFQELNKLLIPESQPFPLIDDLIVQTKGCKWFSSLDINSPFWTIPVRKKDRQGFCYSAWPLAVEKHAIWS